MRSLLRSARAQSAARLALNGLAVRSQQWMLTAAGIDASGPRGMIRAQGLAVLFGSVLRTWVDDDDPGLARTMAALDRALARGQRFVGLLDDLCAIPSRLLPAAVGAGAGATRMLKNPLAVAPRSRGLVALRRLERLESLIKRVFSCCNGLCPALSCDSYNGTNRASRRRASPHDRLLLQCVDRSRCARDACRRRPARRARPARSIIASAAAPNAAAARSTIRRIMNEALGANGRCERRRQQAD